MIRPVIRLPMQKAGGLAQVKHQSRRQIFLPCCTAILPDFSISPLRWLSVPLRAMSISAHRSVAARDCYYSHGMLRTRRDSRRISLGYYTGPGTSDPPQCNHRPASLRRLFFWLTRETVRLFRWFYCPTDLTSMSRKETSSPR
jgi:hypothetical protein